MGEDGYQVVIIEALVFCRELAYRQQPRAVFMSMEFNNELTQRTSVMGSGDENNTPRSNDGGHSVYVTASSTKMDTVVFMHKWSISQFSVQQELSNAGEFLESNTFGSTNGEYKFRLKLFPSGKDEECRGYLSLFLQIIKCPSPKLRFRVNFYIDATDGPRGCALNKNVVTINRGGIVTASKFFSTETLKSRLSRFLPDDVLTVGVELTVYGEQSSCRDLGQLLDSSDFSDFALQVGRRTFRCHKAILSARSPFFQAMFRNQSNQENVAGEAILEDITAEAVSAILEYIYKDNCSDLANHPMEIMAAADRFCLDRLKLQCQEVLVRDMTVANVCERLRAADLYGAPKLKKKALSIFQRNRQAILESREWNDLETDCPSLAASVLKQLMTFPEALHRSTSVHDSATPVKRPRIV
ncbi:BTB and MATH domain-containing protein 41 [Toxocara canis]|uniref:BTB and MATH domain-containing protein 41 n=1 Tax=Toxocara canis TaxID=6265 RepID=A0A0B2VK88_TOXCA|nr:BTB and MATH domain-containing protein 41 [Toxocara canis]